MNNEKNKIAAMIFSIVLLLGIVVSSICDMAISGEFTWSLIVISAIVLAWLLVFPIILYGRKAIMASLIFLTALIIPFLYILENLIGMNGLIVDIGVKVSILTLIYIWCVFLISKASVVNRLMKIAISLLLTIPLSVSINFMLFKMMVKPLIDQGDILNYLIILSCVMLFLVIGILKKMTGKNKEMN